MMEDYLNVSAKNFKPGQPDQVRSFLQSINVLYIKNTMNIIIQSVSTEWIFIDDAFDPFLPKQVSFRCRRIWTAIWFYVQPVRCR